MNTLGLITGLAAIAWTLQAILWLFEYNAKRHGACGHRLDTGAICRIPHPCYIHPPRTQLGKGYDGPTPPEQKAAARDAARKRITEAEATLARCTRCTEVLTPDNQFIANEIEAVGETSLYGFRRIFCFDCAPETAQPLLHPDIH